MIKLTQIVYLPFYRLRNRKARSTDFAPSLRTRNRKMRIFRLKFSENSKFRMRAIMPFVQEEFDKIQQALSRSYAERDKYAGEMDKLREELERVQVKP